MAELIINSQAFKYNLNLITQHLCSCEQLALVLKDNAYGHGLKEIAQLAKAYGIKSVFVKNEFEALQIQDDFEHITAFYGCISPQAPQNIYPCIQSLSALQNLSPNRGFELEINGGMNRNGLSQDQLEEAFELIAKKDLRLIGVFTHNGFADEGGEMMKLQEDAAAYIQAKVLALCAHYSLTPPRFHSYSSSGTLRGEKIREIVRIGIAAYGYSSFEIGLKPIASLWAEKICSHLLKKGERIGYGGAWEMLEDGIVSSYDLGYGDGLFRIDENTQGELLCADGERILPRMSMDCFSALSQKEKICLFEDARAWAHFFHTIPYEILTKLSPFLKRKVV